MSTKTLIIVMTSAVTCLVENVINLAPGTPFDPPAGRVLLTVARSVYVGPGFSGTLDAKNGWTFAPPEPTETPEEPVSVQDQISALEVVIGEAAQRLDSLKAIVG